jgi:hypothetical protein
MNKRGIKRRKTDTPGSTSIGTVLDPEFRPRSWEKEIVSEESSWHGEQPHRSAIVGYKSSGGRSLYRRRSWGSKKTGDIVGIRIVNKFFRKTWTLTLGTNKEEAKRKIRKDVDIPGA